MTKEKEKPRDDEKIPINLIDTYRNRSNGLEK